MYISAFYNKICLTALTLRNGEKDILSFIKKITKDEKYISFRFYRLNRNTDA